MKRIAASLLAISFLTLTGCAGEEEARQYAQELIKTLKAYRVQLDAKARAEQKAYKALAVLSAKDADTDLLKSLQSEVAENGDRMMDAAIAGKTPSNTALIDSLKTYAVHSSDATRDLLFRESDGVDQALSALNALSVDSASIDAAASALDTLTKKPSFLKEVTFLKDFASSTRSCLNSKVCADLKTALDAANAQLSPLAAKTTLTDAEKAQTAMLTNQIATIKARQAATGCNATPAPTCDVSTTDTAKQSK